MHNTYYHTVILIERLHRLFLEVIKQEIDRRNIRDINNVQCLLMYNISDNHVNIGELTTRGYYMGSNVSYNLKKLIQHKYAVQEPSAHDKRSSTIRLTKKGLDLCRQFETILKEHVSLLEKNNLSATTLKDTATKLQVLEYFWSHLVSHRPLVK